jgi:hypothetical protein
MPTLPGLDHDLTTELPAGGAAAVSYLYEEWAPVDTMSHQARMERLRDWQQEYLESLAAEQQAAFDFWESQVSDVPDWLALLEETT